ncbi:MAG: hypothetical protein V4678_02725 [Patescibacteria group bacterium]
MRGTNQGGSLAGFIIIGVLLTLVLVGGLYGLNRYNDQRAADQIAADESRREKEQQQAEEEATKPTTPTAEETEKGDVPPETTVNTDRARTNDTSSTPAPTAATEAQLPQTGPADTLATLVVLGALTFATAHFVRSRSV